MPLRIPGHCDLLHLNHHPIRPDCSYRGYGMSEGRPNERGLKEDAEAAMAHLLARQDVDSKRVVVYGRSLGGAVALHLAAAHQDKVGIYCFWQFKNDTAGLAVQCLLHLSSHEGWQGP